MKLKTLTACLAATGTMLAAQALQAQTFAFNDTDLLLTIRQGDNAGNDFEVNIGNISTYRAPGSTFTVPGYTLTQFSNSLASSVGLKYSVLGGDRSVGGANQSELFLTKTRNQATPNTQSSPWKRQDSFSQDNVITVLYGVTDSAEAATPSTSTSLNVLQTANAFSYNSKAGTSGNLGGTWTGSIETANSTNGFSFVRSDLYDVKFDNVSPGTQNAQFLGYFDFFADGHVTFTPSVAVPEPGTVALAVVGGSALAFTVIRRRKNS